MVFSSSLIHQSFKERSRHTFSVSDESTPFGRLSAQIAEAYDYVEWNNLVDTYIDKDGIVKDTVTSEDVTTLSEKLATLTEEHQALVAEKMDKVKSSFDSITHAKNLVDSLFTSADRAAVRPDVSRADYNAVMAAINDLAQENLKATLTAEADRSLPTIEEAERIAREKAEAERRAREEEQRKIAASWHTLNLDPYYINQFSYEYWNGCEAASVLMAAKYKGYLRGMGFTTFANNMPKAENPNQGFYLSMTEPRNGGVAHWIAPAPLASYANAQGIRAQNVSGFSLDQLDAEIANGNPVIIYLTYRYVSPLAYHNGVPDNLHVVVLSGYNSYTGEQQFYDPAPTNGTKPSLSKSYTEYLYNASGRRALVIR